VYGHPLANSQWDKEFKSTLLSMKFEPNCSAPSIMVMHDDKKTTNSTPFLSDCAINTDDTLFATPFDSNLKDTIMKKAQNKYHITTEDPAINYLGMMFVRNRENRAIDIFLPKFMAEMTIKYPRHQDNSYPSTPIASSRYISVSDRQDKEILRTKVLYESRANKIIEDFHLPATDQASDIGTKATEPSVFQKILNIF
jgi:hypothetical protein